jgi:hypothetical protein
MLGAHPLQRKGVRHPKRLKRAPVLLVIFVAI